MIELFLDTTVAKVAKVKITEGEKPLCEVEGTEPLPTIVTALKEAGLTLQQIDAFKANAGPGSYTGIRIGLAVVNALNWAFGKKVTPQEPKYLEQ